MCVYLRERERDWERERECVGERECMCVCVCVCVRERRLDNQMTLKTHFQNYCVSVFLCVFVRG